MKRFFKRCLAAGLLLFLASSCSSDESIRVGVIAGLTGKVASMGTAGRDGALLAVEEVNARGGINGRMIELVVRNDRQDVAACRQEIEDLLLQEVVAIVGPMTSAMALEIVPAINRRRIPTISPTVSSAMFAGNDDYFFRVIPVSSLAAVKAAEYIYGDKRGRNVLVVYDEGNRAYTETWYEALRERLETFDGAGVEGLSYVSRNGYDFLELARIISAREVDCLVILANGFDTAMISQQLAKLQVKVPVIASEWSLTDDLLEFGGSAINGMELFHSFNYNDDSATYLEFSRRFMQRFGYHANFPSSYAYNAMMLLIEGLRRGTASDEIKQGILNASPYSGVQGEIVINRHGDAEHPYTLLRIEDGKVNSL